MKATIIGGGIIGLSTAWYLQQENWEVTVLDRGNMTEGCSYGNMGYLSPSHFVPLAQPGVLKQGILWMFKQKSPFYVRPALDWQLIDWGLKFAAACNAEHAARSAKPLVDLLLLSRNLTEQWEKSGEMQLEFAPKGCINYFQTAKYEKGELENARLGRELGLQIDVLDQAQCRALEPDLHPDVQGGVWYKDDAILYPNALMAQMIRLLESRGVNIIRNATVTALPKKGGNISAVQYSHSGTQEQHTISDPGTVVLAAGSWSPAIAKAAGEYLPMMPGKGYSMTIDTEKQLLRYPCILLEAKVALTPYATRLRIGSTMEIGAMNDRILFPRVQGILEAVPRFFPGYNDDPAFRQLADLNSLQQHLKEKVWFGYRPLSADGLPYIGRTKKTGNLLIATGHAMLGLSMAAATGKLISEMAAGKQLSMDASAFDPARY